MKISESEWDFFPGYLHYNLEKVTPWEHAAVDPYRHTGSELIEIIQGVGKYKGF